MSAPKRYSPTCDIYGAPDMEEDQDGDYVDANDYDAKAAEFERLRAERAQMHADHKTQNDAIVRLQDEVERQRALLREARRQLELMHACEADAREVRQTIGDINAALVRVVGAKDE